MDIPIEPVNGLRPPAPVPPRERWGPFAAIRTLQRNPLEAWTAVHFEEPIVFHRFAFGRVAVVSEPRAVRKVLVENAAHYRKSALQKRVLSVALRDGLLTVEGDRWWRQRRTLAPLFARRPVRGYAGSMLAAIDAIVERWRAHGPSHVLDLGGEMNRLALDGLVRTCFSDGLPGDPDAMRTAVTTYFEVTGRIDPFDVLGLPGFIPRPTRWRVRSQLRYFDAAVTALIAAGRKRMASAPDQAPRDLLAAMLAAYDPLSGQPVSDTEAKANILTFIAAGQETTASALTWSLFLLWQAPGWRERVQAEAETAFDGSSADAAERLPMTRAVLDEALRLYPPIMATSRVADRPDELVGHAIKPGTMVIVAPYVLHRHRRLWDKPDVFDPARFLPGASRAIERGAYIPFGTGARMCLGASFAHQEATIALARLVQAFDLRFLPNQSVWPQQRMILQPRDPLLATARSRHA
jgi:cytochrome P450